MILPPEAIDRLLLVPHAPGQGDWTGADCWGVVELWYRHVLGIEVSDRAAHAPGHSGLQAGFEAASDWQRIEAPEDHCLVIMRAHGFRAGHVGVFFGGNVIHSDAVCGCVCQPIGDRLVRAKTTAYLRHRLGTAKCRAAEVARQEVLKRVPLIVLEHLQRNQEAERSEQDR